MSTGDKLYAALDRAIADSDFEMVFVSTHQGLTLASLGADDLVIDRTAALTALFDDVAQRADRDLGLVGLDELALRHRTGRLVVRPVAVGDGDRVFVAAAVPAGRPWRRATNRLVRDVAEALPDLSAFL